MEFLKQLVPLVPLVFALVALSNLVLAVISRIGKKPALSVYQAGAVEIGFGKFGPVIALLGTLRTQRAEAFITKIELLVLRPQDGFSRLLEWGALRPFFTLGFGSDRDIQVEMATPFSLKKDDVFKYNLVFVDEAFLTETSSLVARLRDKWRDFNEENQAVREDAAGNRQQLEEFFTQDTVQDAARTLGELFYWEAGDYELELRIHESSLTTPRTFSFGFAMSQRDSEALRENVNSLIRQLCVKNVEFHTVRVQYRDPANDPPARTART